MTLKRLRQEIRKQIGLPTWRTEFPATDELQAKQMWDFVVEKTGDPLLVEFLARLIDIANVPARDPKRLARAIQLYSARKIKFFRERPERFQSPLRTVAFGIGDCDDKSIFIASSLRTFRIPVRLKFMRYDAQQENGSMMRVGHVWPEAMIDGKWIPLESVREYPWGYDPMMQAKKNGILVDTQVVGE
jgi:transglutaminase-like putative cysteine protease